MTNYEKVKIMDPDGYRKAVEIGSLLTCSQMNDPFDRMVVAAKIEQAIMALLADRIERGEHREGEKDEP